MSLCIFNSGNDEYKSCKYYKKYGDYCYKHRRNYLINEDKIINSRRFTGLSKDYLKDDLLYYYHTKIKYNKIENYNTIKKEYLFQEIKKYIDILNKYDKDHIIKNIIKIQSLIRGKNLRDKINIKCNNDEDFYTFDLIKDIPIKYFYSYIDKSNHRWGFDIRSLEKLINMGYSNPYTTENIPIYIIEDIKQKLIKLKQDSTYDDLTEIIKRNRKDTIKQKIVDLFSFIEQSGHSCQIEWITNLNIRKLKNLYRQLEDIWNYRSQLSYEVKCNICPPNADIFKTPVSEVMNYNCKEDLQELIIHDIMKFTQAINDSDRKLGFMYFLIGLAHVSRECYLSHIEWLGLIMN